FVQTAAELASELQARPCKAFVNGQSTEFQNAKDKFAALAAAWRRHNRGKSIVDYYHLAHLQVIGMGATAIPLILEDLSRGEGSWYFALKCITGEQADGPTAQGEPEVVRLAWLQWGERNGLTPKAL